MSAVPAADFLTDFGAGAQPMSADRARVPDANAESMAAKLEEAYGRGLLTGRAAAQAQFNTKLNEQRTTFVAELAAERLKWAAEVGEVLANQVTAAIADFEARVAETAARVLRPFIETELRKQAMEELRAGLSALVSADPSVNLQITAPPDVLEMLAAQLAERSVTAEYVASDDCEVKIVAGPAALETCLRHWMDRLEEITREAG
jgi:predicted nucleotidyltransferase